MAHTSSISYDAIRELDEVGRKNVVPEMSITSYMMPISFKDAFAPIKMEHIRNIMVEPSRALRALRRDTRIRVKNIHTGVRFEFKTKINSARFVGATNNAMSMSIGDKRARVYCIDGEEYVFEYDGHDRPTSSDFVSYPNSSMGNEVIEVVSSTGERTPHYSYLSVAKQLGLLIRHITEEESREKKGELAKGYVFGKKVYTIEFGGRRRKEVQGRCIRCHWKGIYDKDGDWEKISRINVTRLSHEPIIRNTPY